ncbi:MAG: PE-PPE domain-containing protein, partial [Mycobacterium sp.]
MSRHKLHWLGASLLAGAGASLMTLTSAMNAAFASADNIAFVIGGSGIPIPPPPFVEGATELYIDPLHPGYTSQPLFTPEGLNPLLPNSLPFDTSVAQGLTILNNAIEKQIADDNDVVVFGQSQSATISGLEMSQLAALPAGQAPTADQLAFALVGDPDAPNGGLLSRFPDLTLPSIGITFPGPTPADTIYPTDIWTQEYDGFADYPQYPINLLADVNALLGINYLHLNYVSLQPDQVSGAIPLPTSPGYDGVTHYFMIPLPPTENLPLLDPLAQLGVPQAFLDLVQPDLTVLVNLGYGGDDLGYSLDPANVETPFGVFPDVNPLTVLDDLATGTQQGISKFVADLPSLPSELMAFLDPTTLVGRLASVLEHIGVGASLNILSGAPPPATPIEAVTSFLSNISFTNSATADIAHA